MGELIIRQMQNKDTTFRCSFPSLCPPIQTTGRDQHTVQHWKMVYPLTAQNRWAEQEIIQLVRNEKLPSVMLLPKDPYIRSKTMSTDDQLVPWCWGDHPPIRREKTVINSEAEQRWVVFVEIDISHWKWNWFKIILTIGRQAS